jgi:hypothetical protein
MAELITVARPYAQAAFALASEHNALPVWAEMLKLASAVVPDPKVHEALDNPRLSAGDKESLFLSLCGDKLNAEGRNFVRVLVNPTGSACCRRSARFSTPEGQRGWRAVRHLERVPVTDKSSRAQGGTGEAFRQEESVDIDPN